MFISLTAAVDYTERFRDMYTFSELIWNIRKVGKIDSRKMQGQSAFSILFFNFHIIWSLKGTNNNKDNHMQLWWSKKGTKHTERNYFNLFQISSLRIQIQGCQKIRKIVRNPKLPKVPGPPYTHHWANSKTICHF